MSSKCLRRKNAIGANTSQVSLWTSNILRRWMVLCAMCIAHNIRTNCCISCNMNKTGNRCTHIACAFFAKFLKFHERKHSLKILCYWSEHVGFFWLCCYVLLSLLLLLWFLVIAGESGWEFGELRACLFSYMEC